MSNPFPPLGAAIICQQWPVSLSPDAAYSYVAQAFNPGGRPKQIEQFVPFSRIRDVTVSGKEVFIDNVLFVRAASPQAAMGLAKLLKNLASTPAQQRECAIDAALRSSLDVRAVERRLGECRDRAGLLRWLANGLFIHLFAVVPAVAYTEGLAKTWLVLLAVLLGMVVFILLAYHRAHKALYPQDWADRWSHIAIMSLAPLAAIRTPDVLCRGALSTFHPLAAARVLLPQDLLLAFARRCLLDIRHPIHPPCPDEDPHRRAAEEWFRTRLAAAFERFLRDQGLDPESLVQPPQPEEEIARSFCPRCDREHLIDEGECSSCHLPLQPFAPRGKSQ
jgi:hypothetical protein